MYTTMAREVKEEKFLCSDVVSVEMGRHHDSSSSGGCLWESDQMAILNKYDI
jgi:hypothetical protein